MVSIESIGAPLAYPVANPPHELPGGDRPWDGSGVALRTVVRELEGMQKEAVVTLRPFESVWRVVSDEGPYLNGTDLAPFPLAFFSAGMQFSLMSEILQAAARRGVPLEALAVEADNRYSMEGSFLRGDAHGGAFPPEITVSVQSPATPEAVAAMITEATVLCPAQTLVRDVFANTFTLTLNGAPVDLEALVEPEDSAVDYDESRFDALKPAVVPSRPLIEKIEAAEVLTGVEGGAGSSLKAEQKRILHVHSEGRWIEGMRTVCDVRLIKPIGSTFRFHSDEVEERGGDGAAPPPLVYLTAGIGFCYMTQLGRYSQIIKRPLDGYAIVQDNAFSAAGPGDEPTRGGPTETHVFLSAAFGTAEGADLVTVGERTCFLHAAMRTEVPSRIQAKLNGESLALS